MRRDAFINMCQALGAALIYAPTGADVGASSVVDHSGNERHGTLENGAALVSPGLIEGGAAASLDGTNDYVETGWKTRTNLIPDPLGKGAGTVSLPDGECPVLELPQGNVTTALKIKTEANGAGSAASCAVVSGTTYRFSRYVRIEAKTASGLYLQLRNAADEVKATGATFATVGGGWSRMDVSFTADSTGNWQARINQAGAGYVEFHTTAVLNNASASLDDYFPTPAQLESGEAGWSGTAHASASDIGPFVRGTARTFAGLAQRASNGTEDILLGSGGSPPVVLRIDAESTTVRFSPNFFSNNADWAGAWPGNDQPVFWALIFDEVANTAELFINGASQGVKTMEGVYANGLGPGVPQIGARSSGSSPFHGSMLPFAVFLGELSAAQLLTIARTSGFAPVPPRALAQPGIRVVSIEQGGEGLGYDLTDEIEGLSWSSVNPGGDERCGFTLRRSWFSANPEIARGNLIRVMSGIDVLWQGRVEETDRGGELSESIAVTAYGLGARLKDGTFQEIFIDRDLTAWGEPSTERRKQLSKAGISLMASTSVGHSSSDDGAGTPGASIINDFTNVETVATDTEAGEVVYDSGGVDIGEVPYDFLGDLAGVAGNADWENVLALGTTDLFTTAEFGTDHNAAEALNQSVTAPAAGYKFAKLRDRLAVAAENADLKRIFAWQPRVVGNHGLTTQGSQPDEGFTVDQMVGHIVSLLEGIIARRIDGQEYVVKQAAFKEPTSHENGIVELNKLEGADWGTWGPDSPLDTSADGQFDFKDREPDVQHWFIPREDCEDLDLHSETSTLYGAVDVNYEDEAGARRTLRREIDVPDLDGAGLSRVYPLDIGKSTKDVAEQMGDAFLAIWGQFAPARGSFAVSAPIRHHMRGELSPVYLRADGSNARVGGILPSSSALTLDASPDRRTTFPIRRAEVDCSGAVPVARVEIDQSNDTLSILQSRQGLESSLVS